MPQVHHYEAMVARVRNYQGGLAKAASHPVTETDPNEQGTVSIPTDPGSAAAAQNLPTNWTANAPAPAQLTDRQLKPGPTGTNVPSTVAGDSLSKIASGAAAITARIQALRTGVQPAVKAAADDAVASDIQLTPEFHFKLASEILATEDGMAFAEKILTKRAGQVAAHEMVAQALQAEYHFAAYAQQEDALQKQAAHEENIIEGYFKSASADDQVEMIKFARVHAEVLDTITDPMEKAAYISGCKDAAAMMDSAEQGGGQPGQPPEAGVEAEPEIPGGGEGPQTLEEVVAVLEHLVQSGQIDQATAEEVVKALVSGEVGGEGAPEDQEGAPHGALPEEMEAKEASALWAELIPAFRAA